MLFFSCALKTHIQENTNYTIHTYGTAQFYLDICMRVLVQSLEKFGAELASFPRAHDPWHAFNPRDELYAREVHSSVVYFTREQSRYM